MNHMRCILSIPGNGSGSDTGFTGNRIGISMDSSNTYYNTITVRTVAIGYTTGNIVQINGTELRAYSLLIGYND